MVYEILCGASLFLKIDMTFPQICFPISANCLFSFPNIFNVLILEINCLFHLPDFKTCCALCHRGYIEVWF